MRHWVFDLDGTLIDSFSFYVAIVKDIFSVHGLTLESHQVNHCLGQVAEKFFASHLREEQMIHAMDILKSRSRADVQKIKPFLGIESILRNLNADGNRIAIWTSRDLESATLILEATTLREHVEICVSGNCVENHKPHPEGLYKISQHFDCEPEELIVIGDHDYDMAAAKKVGAKAIRAAWHSFDPPSKCDLADSHFQSVESFSGWCATSRIF